MMTRIDVDREAAASRRNRCIEWGTHNISEEPDDNEWCMTGPCDTGECSDCGRPVFHDDETGLYRHLTEPERGCFLIRDEPKAGR